MKNWNITIRIGDEEPESLIMHDLKDVLEGYLNINRTFFDELLNIVKMIRKYALGSGIEKVIGPDKEDWTLNPWILIMFKDHEKQIPFWMLFKRERDLTGNLVAIGPDQFFKYCKDSNEPDDDIKQLIEYILAYPQKFQLSIIIPNFIA